MKTRQPALPVCAAEPLPALSWAAEWQRQQLACAREGACALARGFDAMYGIQQQAARDAVQHRNDFARRLREQGRGADLLALQADLLRADMESTTRYWQQIAAAAAEMNSELFGCTVHLVNTEDVMAATSARFLHV